MRSTVSRGQPGPWAMRAYSTWTSSVKFTCAFPLQLHFALQERLLHFAFDLLPENSSDVDFVSHPQKDAPGSQRSARSGGRVRRKTYIGQGAQHACPFRKKVTIP